MRVVFENVTNVCLKCKARFTCEHECGRVARQNVWYIRTLFGIRQGSKSTLHKRIVCEFSFDYV